MFEIRLPVIVSEGQKETDTKERDKASVRSLNILIVEDNKDFADLLSNMLTTIGYCVNAAYNGKDGLMKAKQFNPDVIFCDIGLPGMDGYEFSKTIRSDKGFKDVKMIALTGYASKHDMKRALDSGFNTHLAKPVDFATLQQVLGNI